METREKKDGSYIKTAFVILRDVTFTLKVVPFVYSGIYLICMLVYLCDVQEDVLALYDMAFYISTIVIATIFHLSYTLRFCNWYRLQCLLPLFPQVLGLVDKYVYVFGEYSAMAVVGMTVAIFVMSLINVYFVFNR